MPAQDKHGIINVTVVVSVLLLALGMAASCRKKQPSTPAAPSGSETKSGSNKESDDALSIALGGSGQTAASVKKLADETKEWAPVFEPWWGKTAPDFTLTDIAGTVHTLSKYRGKTVVVLFWRPNNPTCKMAAARLKELRSSVADDSLVILSISSEAPAALKEAAAAQGINFVVLSGGADLKPPFSSVDTLPTTFFIDPKGLFKAAAMGVVPIGDAKTIIEAK